MDNTLADLYLLEKTVDFFKEKRTIFSEFKEEQSINENKKNLYIILNGKIEP